MSKPLKVALLGAGVVGSQVARIILEQGDTLESRIGRRLELVGVGVKRLDTERPGIDPALLTTDLEALVSRAVMYDLVELGETVEIDGVEMFAVRSGGVVFPVMLAAELDALSR